MIKKILILILFATPVYATETVLTVSKDVYLNGSTPTVNQNSAGLESRDNNVSYPTFAEVFIFSVDFSSISASDTCDSAVIKATPDGTSGSSATWNVFELLQTTWNEGQATWQVYSTGNSWGEDGAKQDAVDMTGDEDGTTSRLAYFTGTPTTDSQITFTDVDLCTYIEPLFGVGEGHFVVHQADDDVKMSLHDDESGTSSEYINITVNHSAAGGGGSRRVIMVN